MATYITRKILMLIPMLLVISFLIYAGIEIMPGDVVDALIPPDVAANIGPEAMEELRESMGLNDPFLIRYLHWLGNILHGDFGYSLQSGVPVSQILLNYLPATLELSVVALIFSTIAGSLLGVVSALKKGSIGDNILTLFGMIGVAIPQFLFGLLCIVVFNFKLNWLPAGGRMLNASQSFLERLPYLIMPALVLGLSMLAGVMRYSRSSMLDSMNREYIKTARSKGLPEWRINLVHGLRVALTPVVVLVGFRLPMLIGGAVVVEQVFQWPGIGQLFVTAVRSQNTPVVMIIGFFSVMLVLVASLLVDIMTAALDPRIKFS